MSLNKKDRETKGIKAILIFEIIGRPPEHLKEALEEIIKRIGEEKGVEVREKKINEPVLMKESEEATNPEEKFYTTFAEVEVEVEQILHLSILMFKYMPAHVEIIEPELIALSNNGWSDIFSELTRRLHGYDEIARILQLQNAQMQQKMRELTPEPNNEKIIKKKENKASTIEAEEKIEKAKFREEKHATKVKSPKQEKNDKKGYNKQSRGR